MNRRAFTLIEVLVVAAILALLLAILLPILSQARESSRAAVCLSNMRQMAIATVMYAHTNRQLLPSVGMSHGSHVVDEQGSWFRLLQEYARGEMVYQCPSDRSPWWDQPLPGGQRLRKVSFATNNYVSGEYEDPSGLYRRFNRLTQIERPHATIFAVELTEGTDRTLGANYWEYAAADHIHPDGWLLDPLNKPRTQVALDRHVGQANYTFLDGHAEMLPFNRTYAIDPASTPGRIIWLANKYDPPIAQ